MIALGCGEISLSYGINTVLEGITFSIQNTDKVGVVGVNGAGKSTMFKIITGQLLPDSGEVFIAKDFKLGYLEQNSGLDTEKSILEELTSTFSHLIDMEKRLKDLEHIISTEKDPDRLASRMKEYSNLTERFSREGGYEYQSRVKGVLKGLGFAESQFQLQVKSLSGGQKTRMALGRLLLEEPDILLLDEPTNHLDIDAIEWLEDYLRNYKKAVMLISHDRYFLDITTTKTLEIESTHCKLYNGNYSSYVKQKAVDREIQQRHFENQQREIARMEAYIEQQRRWNRERNIIAAESRQKAIDRMEKIEKPENLPDKIRLKFKSSIISGNDVLFVENLTMAYPGKPLFKDISFKVKKAENIFLLGPNGCGKSTLLKILSGNLEQQEGIFEYGHKVELGYYDQEQQDLDDTKTVIEEVWDKYEKLGQTEIRNALASFLFTGEDAFKQISVLSGGEKSRVSLVKLMLSGSNLLLLDEPTNHLDINSREVLEKALQDYEGTIIAVSHDRYFINKLATRILVLEQQSLSDFSGNYEQYTQYQSRQKTAAADLNSEAQVISSSKLERQAQKEEQARQRKVERLLNETEQNINSTEERLKEIEQEMVQFGSDHLKLEDLHSEQIALKQNLEELYTNWEELSTEKLKWEPL